MKKQLLFTAFYSFAALLNAQSVQWAKNYPSLGEYTSPRSLEVNNLGELILAGKYWSSGSYNAGIFLHKMDPAGNLVWNKNIYGVNPSGSTYSPYPAGLTVNAANKIYLGGNFSDTLNINGTSYMNYGPDNIFIAKYDSGGNADWVEVFNDAKMGDIYSDGSNTYIVLSFSGPITMFGQTFVSTGAMDLLLLKLGPADNLLWSKQFNGDTKGVKVRTSSSGNIFLLGGYRETFSYDTYSHYTSTDGSFYGEFLMKMDPAGNQLYFQDLWSSQQQRANDLVISTDEKAMVGGQSCWTNGCVGIIK